MGMGTVPLCSCLRRRGRSRSRASSLPSCICGLGARGQSHVRDGFVCCCKFVNGMCICLNLLFFGQILTRLLPGGQMLSRLCLRDQCHVGAVLVHSAARKGSPGGRPLDAQRRVPRQAQHRRRTLTEPPLRWSCRSTPPLDVATARLPTALLACAALKPFNYCQLMEHKKWHFCFVNTFLF